MMETVSLLTLSMYTVLMTSFSHPLETWQLAIASTLFILTLLVLAAPIMTRICGLRIAARCCCCLGGARCVDELTARRTQALARRGPCCRGVLNYLVPDQLSSDG